MTKKLYGTDPDQVPTNADLGTIAYQDKDNLSVSKIQAPNDGSLNINPDSGHTQIGRNFSQTNYTVSISKLNTEDQLQLYNYGGVGTNLVLNDSNWSTKIRCNAGTLEFYSGGTGTKSAWFNTARNLVFPNGNGIDFSASAGGGQTSSLLDDYEEGTFTPTFTGSSTAPSLTYISQTGRYVKVGNLVTIWIQLRIDTFSSYGCGNLRVGGLPFTVDNNVAETGGSVGLWLNMASSTGYETIQQRGTATQLFVMQNTTNSSHTVSAMANGGYLRCTTSYTAA